MAPRSPIIAPQATPPRYGLLAGVPTIEDGARWEGGVDWAPEQCGDSGAFAVDCPGSTPAQESSANPDTAVADPFAVFAEDRCGTFGWKARDRSGRARRQLEATRSYQVAREFWRGDLIASAGLDNVPLADAAAFEVTNEASSIKVAVGYLELALAECGQGRRGVIHVTPQALLHGVAQQVFMAEPGTQRWMTALGTIVIADAGYDGSAPDGSPPGTGQWAYGTSMVTVRLGVVDITPPGGDEAAMAQAMDRSINSVVFRAEQLVLVQWDPCCHYAAELDIPTNPLTAS